MSTIQSVPKGMQNEKEKIDPYGSIFLLASSVEDVDLAFVVVEGDLFAVRVCLSGVVLLHKVTVHELESQGGFAHTARPDHDDLVQWQLLLCLLSHLFQFCSVIQRRGCVCVCMCVEVDVLLYYPGKDSKQNKKKINVVWP